MDLDRLRDPQSIALKAQRMGMVLPTSPAVLDLRTGQVRGDPVPATRLNGLKLLAPPPSKPALLDPPAHVTVVDPPATQQNSSGNTARGSHRNPGRAGRNDHTRHTSHIHHTSPTRSH
jgi:hypothetical protein